MTVQKRINSIGCGSVKKNVKEVSVVSYTYNSAIVLIVIQSGAGRWKKNVNEASVVSHTYISAIVLVTIQSGAVRWKKMLKR